MTYRVRSVLLAALLVIGVQGSYSAQEGRIFFPTDDTIALWEFNFAAEELGIPLLDGTVIPDLSGNGLHATVEANGAGNLDVGEGDLNFGDGNTTCHKVSFGSPHARVVVNDDNDAFEMGPEDDFTIELYVVRDEEPGTENWGYLAGTAHSRNLIDDTQNEITDGAWYGYGYIRDNDGGGWAWVTSSVNADGTFTPSWNEPSSGRFEIPAGPHYLVASTARNDPDVGDITRIYLDGEQVAERAIPDGRAFITPPGRDHARMMFLAAEDDASRNAYRPAPSGYAIDAARVQSVALSAEEVLDNWLELQDGVPIPPDQTKPTAVITASATSVLSNQCVLLSAEDSTTGEGTQITKYEWQIGGGAFEVGEVTREVSFSAPGGDVTLRVTNSKDEVSTATVAIVASQPASVARIDAERGGDVLTGDRVVLLKGDTITLDGTTSSTPIPADAFVCPLADGNLIPAPPITEYRWDLNSDGTVDSTQPALDAGPWDTPGDSTITLTVVNEAGGEGSTTLDVTVRDEAGKWDPAPSGRIFLPTDETIGIWEFNDFDFDIDEPLLTGTIIPDLSGNGLDATVENNDGGQLVVRDGDLNFDDNTACGKAFAGAPRVVVNDDGDAFEMGPDDDFTVELYVVRDEVPGTENWGYLAGTAHSRNLVDDTLDPIADGAWYGYGYIRDNGGGGWAWVASAINPDGTFNPSWNEPSSQPRFEIPAGSHYLVASVDRQIDRASIYLDGELVSSVTIADGQAFITPTDDPDRDHARFMFLAAEDDASRDAYRPAPTGYGIDAARVQRKALSAEEVLEYHQLITLGIAVPPSPLSAVLFHRGDPNDDGILNITDAITILEFLFGGGGGGEAPSCMESADVNNDRTVNLTDAVALLGYLFGGEGDPTPPAPPGPPTEPCGPDPDPPGSEGDLGCESYTNC